MSSFEWNFDREMFGVYDEIFDCFPMFDLSDSDILASVSGIMQWKDCDADIDCDVTFLIKVPHTFDERECKLRSLNTFTRPPKRWEYPELSALQTDVYHDAVVVATGYIHGCYVICYM